MVEAESAEEGLKVYKEHEPDFVIVDLMMEEVDAGTAFVKELRALGNTAPVYLLSSVGGSLSETINPADLGLQGVFQKPLDSNALLMVLKQKLRK
jgi:DNA-binding response OmpR family regulator